MGCIVGYIVTGSCSAPALGGFGAGDFDIGAQLVVQVRAVLIAIIWSAIGSAITFAIVDAVLGLRVASDAEREGLDIADHGERAYNYCSDGVRAPVRILQHSSEMRSTAGARGCAI